jgi:hypothetical protein
MPKVGLTNGLEIGTTPIMLPKLAMVEEILIAKHDCKLVKLYYLNKNI